MSTLDSLPETAAEPRPPLSRPAAAVDAGPDRMEPLNLARRPFLNSRPVVRTALLLWLIGLLLLLGNVSLFWSYLSSSADKRQQIAQGEREIERQDRAARQLQGRLDGIDLERQNEQIDFLNEKIEERTFSWSLLLDRIAEALPNDVRLVRLAPETAEKAAGRGRRSQSTLKSRKVEGQVALTITGETRSDEALLRFVDNLFAHPAFADPNLLREERQEQDGLVRFELTMQYIPGKPLQGIVVEEGGGR
jgi:Tfp pilus assembly protein PilN